MKNKDGIQPPKWPNKLLRYFIRDEYLEEIEGDMEEMFKENLKTHSPRKARKLYTGTALKLMKPILTKRLGYQSTGMIYNYFKISWRNLYHHKLYTLINIGGLTLGILCFLAISLYVDHELSYDRGFENSEKIYRIFTHEQSGETYMGSDNFATIPLPLATTIKENVPEIEQLTSFEPYQVLLKTKKAAFSEEGLWVDDNFFSVFPLTFVLGNPKMALSDPKSIILTQSMATKLFGENDPIGQDLERQIHHNVEVFTVTAIIKDITENTSLQFSYLAPLESHLHYANEWNTSNVHTFALLSDNAQPREIESKIIRLLEQHQEKSIWTSYHKEEYLLQPLHDYHLADKVIDDMGQKSNRQSILTFSVVALLILLLACTNYTNLAIARSTNRAREVGLRKVVGARKGQLVFQFISESILLTFIALILALALLALILPYLSILLNRPLAFSLLDVNLIIGIILMVFFVGVICGSYPAFYMSSLRPIFILKDKMKNSKGIFRFQKLLVAGQFTISIIMITCCLIIYSQFQFIQQIDPGYDKEHIVTVRIPDFPTKDKYSTLKNSLLSQHGVQAVTASKELPSNITSNTVINYEKQDLTDPMVMYRTSVADDFLEVYGLSLVTGQDPSNELFSDSSKLLLINESACKALNWQPDEALGQEIKHRGTVIGVVKDFHMLSVHHPIEPVMLQVHIRDRMRYMGIKVQPEYLESTLSTLESLIRDYSDYPFDYRFLDDEFDLLYKQDKQAGKIIGIFSFLAILVASMGLFGMAVFAVNQRTKEIGIRKVLGATVVQLINVLSRDFFKVFFIGLVTAIPLAWYAVDLWLNNFTYKMDLEWWMFMVPGLAVIFFAFMIISSQSVKAALTNPVDVLRDD